MFLQISRKKSARYLANKLDQQKHDFSWFNSKAKIKFTQNGKTQSASANIRMKKDSLIWLTISKIGFEAARMMISPDSVHILLRREKEYIARDFDHFKKEYNLSGDFSTLQHIILGNALDFNRRKMTSAIKSPNYFLSADESKYKKNFWLDGQSLLLAKMEVVENQTMREFEIDYDKYKELNNNTYFAYNRNASFLGDESGDVNLEILFSKVEFEVKKSMPFSVSSRYVRK